MTSTSMNKTSDEQAFTLMELILVMVLLAVVLAIMTPSLRGFVNRNRTADAARHVVMVMEAARVQAINEGVLYRFNLDLETGEYWLTRQVGGMFEIPDDSGPLGQIYVLPFQMTAAWIKYDEDDLESGEDTEREFITFYPSGQAEIAELRLMDNDKRVVNVGLLAVNERYRVLADDERALAGREFEFNR